MNKHAPVVLRFLGWLVLLVVLGQKPLVHGFAAHRAGLKRARFSAQGARSSLGDGHWRERFTVAVQDVSFQPRGLDHRRAVRAHHLSGPASFDGIPALNGIIWAHDVSPTFANSFNSAWLIPTLQRAKRV
jgi:hypothetical protein